MIFHRWRPPVIWKPIVGALMEIKGDIFCRRFVVGEGLRGPAAAESSNCRMVVREYRGESGITAGVGQS